MDYKSSLINSNQRNKTDNTFYDPSREQDEKGYNNYNIGNDIDPTTALYISISNLKENLDKFEKDIKNLREDNKDYSNRISKMETKLDIYEKWLIGSVLLIIVSVGWSFLKQFPSINNDINKIQMEIDFLKQKSNTNLKNSVVSPQSKTRIGGGVGQSFGQT